MFIHFIIHADHKNHPDHKDDGDNNGIYEDKIRHFLYFK